jgi:hypothetical protein
MIRLLVLALLGFASTVRAGELKLLPETVSLQGAGATQNLLLLDQINGVVVGDLTTKGKFTTSDPKIATISASGQLQAVGDGEAIITAESEGKKAIAKVRVSKGTVELAPSFRHDVLAILTRTGCNSGACHGALAGKGGFKLSLRGYDPETDFFVMTRQALGRRVDQQQPEKSLLLEKAIRKMPHGGGGRFEVDSPEYRSLLKWIESGANGPTENDPGLERIEVFPQAALLKPKDKIQVRVRAWYSDGTSKEVTRWSRFGSSEELVAGVTEEGQVTVQGNGEAAITVGFGTQVATMTVTSPYPNRINESVFTDAIKSNFIDEHVLAKLKLLNLPPSEICSDREFIRRLYLDLCGILPTPAEVEKFLANNAKDKRSKLLETLLERPEYVDYWSYKWSDLMLVSTRKIPQQAMWSFYRYIRQSVADNKPWDQFAREILTANGSTLQDGGGNFFVLHKDISELNESVSVTFLGMSVNCCRCHNHPLEKWTQDQYWGMANLFSRVGLKNGERPGEVIVHSLSTGEAFHPRRGIGMAPTPLDAKPLPENSSTDRRVYFVDWLTAKENPYFARAVINRVWKNFLGRGLVEAEDDLRATNPPSNRELFAALEKDFIEKKYDLKHLIRQIVNSQTYQRSSKPLKANAADDRFYSRYLVKRLSAEVILDAMSQVTNVPTAFTLVYTGVEGGTAATGNYPMGTRAMQLPDSRVASKFLDAFGRPERQATCSCERQQDSSVTHALMFNNGSVLNDKLRDKNSRLSQWLTDKLGDDEATRQVFELALSRPPTESELKRIREGLFSAGKEKPEQRREALEDLFWAVLTTKEFLFNH